MYLQLTHCFSVLEVTLDSEVSNKQSKVSTATDRGFEGLALLLFSTKISKTNVITMIVPDVGRLQSHTIFLFC